MNKKYIVIILVVLVCLGLVIYGLVYNSSNSNNKNDEKQKNDISYEDFKNEFGEYNWDDEEIREDNYQYYEDEFFSRKYLKFLECEIKKVNKDAFLIWNNTSDEYLGRIRTTIIFYDENNQIIDVQTQYTNELECGGKTCRSLIKFPLNYAKVDFFNEIDRPKEISNLKISNIKSELSIDGKIIITNTNTEECKSIYGSVFYYDEQGNVSDSSSFYITDGIKPDESKTEKLYNFPSAFASYEIIISGVR